MSKLINIDSNSTTYGDMVAEVLPRGPIWDPSNPGVGGMAGGLGVEAVRFHRRLCDLMLEAYPATADELLAEWEEVFGLPLCTEPDTDDGRRVALAGRVAAQGGQSRAYYIDLAWSVLEADGEFSRVDDPSGVWIEEEPYGSPFEAWGGSAWDLLGGSGARHYWTMHLPSAVGATKRAIIECLLCKYKPAHTVLVDDEGAVVCEEVGTAGAADHYYYRLSSASLAQLAASATPMNDDNVGGFFCWLRIVSGWAQIAETHDGTQQWFLNVEPGAEEWDFDDVTFTPPELATDEWFAVAIPNVGSELGLYFNGAAVSLPGVADGFVRGNGRIYTEDGVFEVLDPCYVDGVVVTTDHIAAHAARGPGADPLLDDGDWDIGGDVIALWRDNIVEGEVANRRALAHPLVVTGGVQALPFEEEE